MNKQEVFNQLAQHLFQQNERSMTLSEGGALICAYRTKDAEPLKCAVGKFIPDALYSRKMENVSANGVLFEQFPELIEPLTIEDAHRVFWSVAQSVHDRGSSWESTAHMRTALNELATEFEIDASIVETLSFKDR